MSVFIFKPLCKSFFDKFLDKPNGDTLVLLVYHKNGTYESWGIKKKYKKRGTGFKLSFILKIIMNRKQTMLGTEENRKGGGKNSTITPIEQEIINDNTQFIMADRTSSYRQQQSKLSFQYWNLKSGGKNSWANLQVRPWSRNTNTRKHQQRRKRLEAMKQKEEVNIIEQQLKKKVGHVRKDQKKSRHNKKI